MVSIWFTQETVKQVLRYGIVGSANTVIGYTVIVALMVLSVTPILSNLAGYAVGLAVAFVLQKRWVFRGRDGIFREIVKFLAAFVLCYLANLGTLAYLIYKTNVNPYVAQAIAGLVYLTFFFALSKYVVFERTRGLVREQPCQHGGND